MTEKCNHKCTFNYPPEKAIAISMDCNQDYNCLNHEDDKFSKICSMDLPEEGIRFFCSMDEGLECKKSNSKYDITQCYTSNTASLRYIFINTQKVLQGYSCSGF